MFLNFLMLSRWCWWTYKVETCSYAKEYWS